MIEKKFRSNVPAAIILGLCLLMAGIHCGPGGGGVTVGKPLANFTLNSLDGQPFNLADQKGKVVLINVFATW